MAPTEMVDTRAEGGDIGEWVEVAKAAVAQEAAEQVAWAEVVMALVARWRWRR